MKFKYKWWGKGDADASLGVFFDGFSKVLTATGIMIFVFGMPADIVLGRIVPAIGVTNFLGCLWYGYEAKMLAEKEKRHNVTAQPFGVGASQLSGWLYLIMGPVYWQTGDAMKAFYIGLAAAFIGGLIEILGALCGKYIAKYTPSSALLGNMASGAFIWLGVAGFATVFDKLEYAVLPLFFIIIDYLGKADKRWRKLPTGIIAIVVGVVIAFFTGNVDFTEVTTSFHDIGFYPPRFFGKEILEGIKGIVPYLPVIIPLQINNFLSTLQGLEGAKQVGDAYPERRSMIMDGFFTTLGAFLGNPFPTTVYYGHAGWKEIDARAGYSVVVAFLYLITCVSGLTGVIMSVIPVEVVMILIVFIGLSVAATTFKQTEAKYTEVILLSMVPIIFQYIDLLIDEVIQAAGAVRADISLEVFAEYSVPITGIQVLSYGAFLSSLLYAAVLACVIDKKYTRAAVFSLILAGCSFIGMIHNKKIAFMPKNGVILGVIYVAIAILLFSKKYIKQKDNMEVTV